MRKKRFALVGMATVAGIGLAVTALGTPSSGVLSAPVVARASFGERVSIKFRVGRETLKVRRAADTVMQQIVIGPGGTTGWHSHPGPVVVLIKAGTLSFVSSEDETCTPTDYTAGEAFIDSGQGHVHIAHNLSATENVELWATYFDVPEGGAFRIDAPDPGTCL